MKDLQLSDPILNFISLNKNKTPNKNIRYKKNNLFEIDSFLPRPSSNDHYYIDKSDPDNNTFYEEVFPFDKCPPMSNTYYNMNENFNSNLKYLRLSMTKIPKSKKELDKIGIPFGIYFQPFAKINNEESPIHEINIYNKFSCENIIKCEYCGTYCNKYFILKEIFNGNTSKIEYKIKCNICQLSSEVNINETLLNIYFHQSDKMRLNFLQERLFKNRKYAYDNEPIKSKRDIKLFCFPYITNEYVEKVEKKKNKKFKRVFSFSIDLTKYSYQIGIIDYYFKCIKNILYQMDEFSKKYSHGKMNNYKY